MINWQLVEISNCRNRVESLNLANGGHPRGCYLPVDRRAPAAAAAAVAAADEVVEGWIEESMNAEARSMPSD